MHPFILILTPFIHAGLKPIWMNASPNDSWYHTVTEALVTKFVGMEETLILINPMPVGFATNWTAFVGKGCLLISDEL